MERTKTLRVGNDISPGEIVVHAKKTGDSPSTYRITVPEGDYDEREIDLSTLFNQRSGQIGFTMVNCSAGDYADVYIPYPCTITGWRLTADTSASVVIDVWRCPFADFPPSVADTIAGSEKPTLSSQQTAQDLDLDTWDADLDAGDMLRFSVDSITGITRLDGFLLIQKT